jgi:hypothetical protein
MDTFQRKSMHSWVMFVFTKRALILLEWQPRQLKPTRNVSVPCSNQKFPADFNVICPLSPKWEKPASRVSQVSAKNGTLSATQLWGIEKRGFCTENHHPSVPQGNWAWVGPDCHSSQLHLVLEMTPGYLSAWECRWYSIRVWLLVQNWGPHHLWARNSSADGWTCVMHNCHFLWGLCTRAQVNRWRCWLKILPATWRPVEQNRGPRYEATQL